MSLGLTCPTCKANFKNIKIEEGEVRCPECRATIFAYRYPWDDDLTPAQFTALLDQRGPGAVQSARRWFRGKLALAAAGAFVAYVWPHLAKTFEKKEVKP